MLYINGKMVTGAYVQGEEGVDEIDETIPCAKGDKLTFSGNWTGRLPHFYEWVPAEN